MCLKGEFNQVSFFGFLDIDLLLLEQTISHLRKLMTEKLCQILLKYCEPDEACIFCDI